MRRRSDACGARARADAARSSAASRSRAGPSRPSARRCRAGCSRSLLAPCRHRWSSRRQHADAAAGCAAADDNLLVKQALQRYRTAYEGLDAQSAHAVWPAVNQAALARAFDGLESQSLTFDACDVRVRGESATATCQGSARYVPKIGSREPRIEPRVWNFSLHKAGGDWKIDTARAER